MANVVLGIGHSHTPQISVDPDDTAVAPGRKRTSPGKGVVHGRGRNRRSVVLSAAEDNIAQRVIEAMEWNSA